MSASPRRILLVSYSARIDRGGQINIKRLLERLPADKFRFAVASGQDGPLLRFARELGHETYVAPVPSLPQARWGTVLARPKSWLKLVRWRRILREFRPRLVYVDPAEFVNAMAFSRRWAPFRILWHAQTAFEVVHDADAVANAERIVPVSSSVEERLRAHGHEHKWVRIPNAVDTDAFVPAQDPTLRQRAGVDEGDTVFLYVGSLERMKGLFELIDAFAPVAAALAQAKLWLVGSGPDETERELEAAIAARGLDDRVRAWGSVPDVACYYAAADVFVFPSRAEGLPLALLEAMAMALPCIATDILGNRDALGDAGVLVPVNDPQPLSAAMLELGNDPATQHDLGARARQRVEERFSLRGYVQAFDELFTELTDTEAPR